MPARLITSSCLVLAAACAAAPAHGATGFSASVQLDLSYNGVDDCQRSSGGPGLAVAPRVSCLGTMSHPDTGLYSFGGAASAAYGVLRAFADTRLEQFGIVTRDTVPDNAFHVSNVVSARYLDTLSFSSGAFWAVTVGIAGKTLYTYKDSSHNQSFDNLPNQFCFSLYGFCPSGAFSTELGMKTYLVPIPASHQLSITPTLSIDASVTMRPHGAVVTDPFSYDQYVNLADTVRITASQILDAQMKPLSDATVTAESGFDYLHPPTEGVPEPSAGWLVVGGLAGIGWTGRRGAR